MPDEKHSVLKMNYSGRIIDQLGIQMYQSPIAAIAELVANSWDADADNVHISLPGTLDQNAEIVIEDDGIGMSFDECESRYLNVGFCRRGENPMEQSREKGRPILGRKGIGKFAGFGIAELIRIETACKETGEKTVFELDLNALRRGEYVTQGQEIAVIDYQATGAGDEEKHGTIVRLKSLKISRRPSETVFLRSMARRFLLHRRAADFAVFVNGSSLPESEEETDIEFVFPRDYRDDEKPEKLVIGSNGWGDEELEDGNKIRWSICFYKRPIDEEELRGVSIFTHGKLSQTPFFFNLTGGLGGQHGQEYMSGQIEANYLDEQIKDFIAPERQRLDFESSESIPLLEWGQNRLKSLFRIWRDRRGERRIEIINQRIQPFARRLEVLPSSERKIIKKAVKNLAKISALEENEFIELSNSILTSWEGGRLKELISEISESETMNETDLLHALIETGVLTALNIAEAIKTKLEAILGLKRHIENRTLENPLRDYVANNPWLIADKWETFKRERSVDHLLRDCAAAVGFNDNIYNGRIDLALSSGEQLLVLEFMRPGLNLDFDHVNRFETYVYQIREKIEVNTALQFSRVSGYIVADGLDRRAGLRRKIMSMKNNDMVASDWKTVLSGAIEDYREYLNILVERAPNDERLRALLD